MGGTSAVLDLLRYRRLVWSRCADRSAVQSASVPAGAEGVIYLTPDGDGYVLYASPSTIGVK
jgi:hypothetical protein